MLLNYQLINTKSLKLEKNLAHGKQKYIVFYPINEFLEHQNLKQFEAFRIFDEKCDSVEY